MAKIFQEREIGVAHKDKPMSACFCQVALDKAAESPYAVDSLLKEKGSKQ
jgi:hypothetical protein